MQGISFYLLLPILPLYVTGPLGEGEETVGILVGAFAFTAVLIRPFAGFLLDRYGRRGWQLLASSLFCISTFSYLFAGSWTTLLLCRLLHGLSWGMVGVASATVAADLIPYRRMGAGIGYYGLAMPVALSVGPMVGAIILAGDQFSRLFTVAGLVALVAFFLFSMVNVPPVRDPDARLTIGRVIEPRVMRLFWFMLPLCIGYGGIVAFAPLHAVHTGMASAAPFFSLYAAGSILSRLMAGRMYDRSGPVYPILMGLALLTTALLLMAIWSTPFAVLLGGAFMGIGFGLLVPAFQAMAVNLVPPARRASANGTIFSSYDVGITIGAIGFGLVASRMGIPTIFAISAGLVVVACLLFIFWVNPHFQRNRL